MIELGAGTAPDTGDLIKDVNESNFMKDVVEASDLVPVIVDFYRKGRCFTGGFLGTLVWPMQNAWACFGGGSHRC